MPQHTVERCDHGDQCTRDECTFLIQNTHLRAAYPMRFCSHILWQADTAPLSSVLPCSVLLFGAIARMAIISYASGRRRAWERAGGRALPYCTPGQGSSGSPALCMPRLASPRYAKGLGAARRHLLGRVAPRPLPRQPQSTPPIFGVCGRPSNLFMSSADQITHSLPISASLGMEAGGHTALQPL
jgi:hypothetical protein